MASWNQKEQEEIEFRIGAIKKFLELWFQYDELFQASFGSDRIDQKSEDEFLQLKSQLARRHQYLLEYLGGEYNGGGPITEFLSDTVTLKSMRQIHPDFYKKLCGSWHKTTLYLNAALGYLQSRLEEQVPLES